MSKNMKAINFTKDHTDDNHLGVLHVRRLRRKEKYKNRYTTTVRASELTNKVVWIGDYWLNEVDYELLKDHLDDCFFWHVAGSMSPLGNKNPNNSSVDGYEIHLMTDREAAGPWVKGYSLK